MQGVVEKERIFSVVYVVAVKISISVPFEFVCKNLVETWLNY